MKKPKELRWLEQPSDGNFESAQTYLKLLYGTKKARKYVKELKEASTSEYLARDLLRASGTPISEVQAFDWTKQQREIAAGTPLSPVLLVRRDDGKSVVIADGFHRMCAVFQADQDAPVPCKFV